MTHHLRTYGDLHHQDQLPFDIDEIYHALIQSGLPCTPPTLQPSVFQQVTHSPPITAPSSTIPSNLQIIVSCEYDPTIMAFSSHRRRCKVCLMGFHDENDCYLQGDNFIDPDFKRRINVYNQNYGNKPPKDHKLKKWNPQSIPPFEFENKANPSSTPSSKWKLFANASSKSSNKPSINSFDHQSLNHYSSSDIDNTAKKLVHFDDMGTPSMASFTYDSSRNDDNHMVITEADDPYQPTACSMQLVTGTNCLVTSPSHHIYDRTSDFPAIQMTPPNICHSITEVHPTKTPQKQFLSQHSQEIHSLHQSNFQTFGSAIFHPDSGANCWGMTSRDAFSFYIKNETLITQVSRTSFSSPGWGGILISIDERVYAMYPVFNIVFMSRDVCITNSEKTHHFS
jgi:hypothetical protein